MFTVLKRWGMIFFASFVFSVIFPNQRFPLWRFQFTNRQMLNTSSRLHFFRVLSPSRMSWANVSTLSTNITWKISACFIAGFPRLCPSNECLGRGPAPDGLLGPEERPRGGRGSLALEALVLFFTLRWLLWECIFLSAVLTVTVFTHPPDKHPAWCVLFRWTRMISLETSFYSVKTELGEAFVNI